METAGWLKRIFSRIPLVGELLDVEAKHFKDARRELIWTTIAATLPIWIYPALAIILFDDGYSLAWDTITNLYQGELYLYSAAIVGSILFALTSRYGEWNSENATAPRIGRYTFLFPYGTHFIVISFFISIVSALLFGVIKFNSAGLIKANLQLNSLLMGSVIIYIVTNICLYLVMVYKSALTDVARSSGSDQKEFVEHFLQSRGRAK